MMKIHPIAWLGLGLSAIAHAGLAYPPAFEGAQIDTYQGASGPVTVADPYRWMEDDQSEQTASWVKAQNEVTFPYLETLKGRTALRERLTQLMQTEHFDLPVKVGGRYFFKKRDGKKNQPILYVASSLDGEHQVLLDPNALSEDNTTALDAFQVSPDAKLVLISLQDKGTDWRRLRVIDASSGADLGEEVLWAKYDFPLAWSGDSRGYFYGRFPKPESDGELTNDHRIYYHQVGTAQDADTLIYQRPEKKGYIQILGLTEDKLTLVIVSQSPDRRASVLVRSLAPGASTEVREIISEAKDITYAFLGGQGSQLYFQTNHSAPNSRIIRVDVRDPRPENWMTVVPEAKEAIYESSLLGNQIMVHRLQDAHSVVRFYDLSGMWIRDLEFPEKYVSMEGLKSLSKDGEAFYSYESFISPASVYQYNQKTGVSTLVRRGKLDFDSSAYETQQVFYTSKDGTRVPMFITAKKGVKLDGQNPTLLYGYGGFNVSYPPYLSAFALAWIERGGVYALANLRGGGEYGESWHRAGTRLNKQNVFDDFIAAAEYLISKGYTRSSRLAIRGGSNGGLLVGACLLQRPDLFGAGVAAVGVMDMLRFNKFTAGAYWVDDYGSPEPLPGQNPADWDAREFDNLLRISPYHQAMKLWGGTAKFPATLITTSDHDDRVVPMHSFKFASALQKAQTGDAPVLIRIEVNAGHGSGIPLIKKIQANADEIAFIEQALGVSRDK